MRSRIANLLLLLLGVLAVVGGCSRSTSSEPKEFQTYIVVRDWKFLIPTYFDLARRDSILSLADLQPGDSITELETYIDSYPRRGAVRLCSLFVDPFERAKYGSEKTDGWFCAISDDSIRRSEFFFHPTKHYLYMGRYGALPLGVWFRYKRPGVDSLITVGDRSDSIFVLKLISPRSPKPDDITWNYMWRNVYVLGKPITDLDHFEVEIFLGEAVDLVDLRYDDADNQRGETFLSLLGLDKDGDGRIDAHDSSIIDPTRGHLIFPSRTPFADSALDVKVAALYGSLGTSVWFDASKYYLLIKR